MGVDNGTCWISAERYQRCLVVLSWFTSLADRPSWLSDGTCTVPGRDLPGPAPRSVPEDYEMDDHTLASLASHWPPASRFAGLKYSWVEYSLYRCHAAACAATRPAYAHHCNSSITVAFRSGNQTRSIVRFVQHFRNWRLIRVLFSHCTYMPLSDNCHVCLSVAHRRKATGQKATG